MHCRDKRITFIEETHTYLIDSNIDDKLVSVTQFVHQFFQEFNADNVVDKMMASQKWSKSKYFGMTKESIKELWDTLRDDASKEGTKMHLGIENFYNNVEIDDYVHDSLEFKHFLNFQKVYPYKAYRTEWRIFDETVKIAGSIDMAFIDPNDPSNILIYDWKRSKEIKFNNSFQNALAPISHIEDSNFWHYALQLNVYKKIIESNYDKKVNAMVIVVFHPLNDDFIKIDIPVLDKEIDLLWKFRLDYLKILKEILD